jgi:hypothetical protein
MSILVFLLAAASVLIVLVMVGLAVWFIAARLVPVMLAGPFATVAPSAPSIIGLPSAAALVLGLVDGALTVLVKGAFGLPSTWQYVISAILIFLGGAGVTPLLGPSFKAALHLPFAVTTLIAAGMSAASYVLAAPVGISHTASIWISGGLAFLAAVGFGTTVQSVAKAAGLTTRNAPR